MNKLSIKKRLLLYSFLIQFVILVIFSFSLYKALDISTLDKLQTTLRVILLDVADDVIENKNQINEREFDEEKEYKFEPLYIRLSKLDNKVEVIKTTKFPQEISINYNNLKSLQKNFITFETQKSYLISKIKITIDSNDYVIEVATNKNSVNSTLENLIYILFFIVPIILILSTIGGYFLIYRSFLPIEEILKKLKNITASNLSKRLVFSDNNDEIDLLTKEINSLITRLEVSFEKISQFTSDASHELKTPLTIIRGEIEVGLRKKRTEEEYIEILNNCLEEISIIQQTTDDLLFLAEAEQQFKVENKEVSYIDEMTLESVNELESFAKLKSINIKCDIKDTLQIKSHLKLLKVAIKNILKNAISYSHENSEVIVRTYIEKSRFKISIQDFGIGISKDDQEKIFDKFYRTDKSRNKNSGGSGLGMAISEKIVKMYDGTIELKSEENIGTTVIISFLI